MNDRLALFSGIVTLVLGLQATLVQAVETSQIGRTTFMRGEEISIYGDWIFFGGCEFEENKFSSIDCLGLVGGFNLLTQRAD